MLKKIKNKVCIQHFSIFDIFKFSQYKTLIKFNQLIAVQKTEEEEFIQYKCKAGDSISKILKLMKMRRKTVVEKSFRRKL